MKFIFILLLGSYILVVIHGLNMFISKLIKVLVKWRIFWLCTRNASIDYRKLGNTEIQIALKRLVYSAFCLGSECLNLGLLSEVWWYFQNALVPWGCHKNFLQTWSLKTTEGVSVVDQWKQIWLVSMRTEVQSLALLSGLMIWRCCGVGRRCGLDLALLWLWHRSHMQLWVNP